MTFKSTSQLLMVLVALLGLTSQTFAFDVDFATEVKPLIEKYCVSCHGPDEDKFAAFRIDEQDEAFDYIEADDAEESQFYQVLVSDDEDEVMPPPDFMHIMSAAEIEVVKNWINEGADWPEDAVLTDTSANFAASNPAIAAGATEAPVGEDTDSKSSDEKKEKDAKEITNEQLTGAVGSLHPAIVHLPIGLLLASGLFAFLSLRGNFVMSDCAYYCLWLGTFGALFSCVTGWFFCDYAHEDMVSEFNDLLNMDHKIFWHRTGGLVLTALSFIVALIAKSARSNDPNEGTFWKLLAIGIACGVGWVGHTGGHLHYGDRLYKDLNAVQESLIGGFVGEAEGKAAPAESVSEETPAIEGDLGTASN